MNRPFERVAVIGLGYIGLPTAAVLAGTGIDVVGVDINSDTVDTINRGEIHIVEPALDALVREAVKAGRLRAATIPELADAFVIAVPTPFKGQHEPDLSYVEAAARAVAPYLKKGDLIILESTCPVGTTEKLTQWLSDARPDLGFPTEHSIDADINVAYCPERVLPGKVLAELVSNDRVIGGITPQCSTRARSLYMHFVKGECIISNARTAEMCKLTENSFRDVNIAFANELSLICDKLGINVWELIRLANHHPRVNILNPGPGVGGHCIAVDPWFIVDSAPDAAHLIRTAREVNDSKPEWVLSKISDAVTQCRRDKEEVVVACLGLAFKANIDDLRESPSLHIVEKLVTAPLADKLLVVEPFIEQLPAQLAHKSVLVSLEEAVEQADIVVLLVDHDLFKSLDRSALQGKKLIDTRGIWR